MTSGDFVRFKDPTLFPMFAATGSDSVLMVTAEHPRLANFVQVSNGVIDEWVRRADLEKAQ